MIRQYQNEAGSLVQSHVVLCLCVHTYVGMCLQRQHGVFVYQCVTPPVAWELGQDGGEKDIEFEKIKKKALIYKVLGA